MNDISNVIASAVEEQTATTTEIGRNVTEAAMGTKEIANSISGVAKSAQMTMAGAADTQTSARSSERDGGEPARARQPRQPLVRASDAMTNQTAPDPVHAPGHGVLNRLGRRIKVLVVDDSVVIRRIISQSLSSDPDLEVVGYAANGLIALQKAAELKPDVITLDIEMPEMDGLTTIRRLREAASTACVIMCSALTSRGASATIDALIHGANDYVTKPSNTGPMDSTLTMLRDELIPELIPKIKQFFEPKKTIAAPSAQRRPNRRRQLGSRLISQRRRSSLCLPNPRSWPSGFRLAALQR